MTATHTFRALAVRPADPTPPPVLLTGPSDQTPPPVLILGPAELPDSGAGGLPAGWEVVVHPLTPQAAGAVPTEGLRVTGLPFRFGRAAAAREADGAGLNDLWLLDEKPFTVSRNHCQIERIGGGLVVRDRGSQLGCVVNGRPVGGRAFDRLASLAAGDNVLVLGPAGSAYRFRVEVTVADPARTVPALTAAG